MTSPHVFQTPWDKMNQALSIVGPLTRSKVALIGGITHSYKTGLLTDLFYHACISKAPTADVTGKIPKILYITADESSSAVMDRLIDRAHLQNNLPRSTGERDLAEDDLQFLTDTLSEGGYSPEFLILPPGRPRTIRNLCSLIRDQITDESEVLAVFIDGVDQIDQQPEADHIEALEVLNSFMVQHNVLCVATHQLSYAALRSKASGVVSFDLLKECYDDARWVSGGEEIAKLVDVEILLDIHRDGSAVDVLCGSHRQGVKVPTEQCLFTIPLK